MADHMADHIMNDELPTLEETLAAGPRRLTDAERKTWVAELAAIERAQDALEPPFPDETVS